MPVYQLRWGIVAVLAAVLGCSAERDNEASTTSYPKPVDNLLFICIDTVRADVFHALGEAGDDPLAGWRERALDFTQVTSTSPWTVPSIGSVFSGLWPYSHGAGRFPGEIARLFTQAPLPAYDGVSFLAEVAGRNDFSTVAFSASAWTYNPFLSMGLLRGFDEITEYETDWHSMVADMGRSMAAQKNNKGSVYLLHLMEAHDWHMEPEEQLDARLEKLSPRDREQVKRLASIDACEHWDSTLCKRYRVYIAAVRELRTAMAATLDNLRESEVLDDTVVIVFSDHGEDFSDHADADRAVVRPPGYSDSHLRYYGHGHQMYEELLHVPLMVWHPGYEAAVIDQPVSLVDVGPSAARWLGLGFQPVNWPGQFLDESLEPHGPAENRVLYASSIAYGEEQVSVKVGERKSIWYTVSEESDYFDLAYDPGEMQPLQAPAWVLQFDGLLLDYMQIKPRETSEAGDLTDKQIRQLQSIGYLQGVDVGDTGESEEEDDATARN